MYTYIFLLIYIYICIYTYIYIYVYICVYMCVRLYVCICKTRLLTPTSIVYIWIPQDVMAQPVGAPAATSSGSRPQVHVFLVPLVALTSDLRYRI